MDFYIFRRFLVIIPAEPILKKTMKAAGRATSYRLII